MGAMTISSSSNTVTIGSEKSQIQIRDMTIDDLAEAVARDIPLGLLMNHLDRIYQTEDVLGHLYFPEVRQFVREQICEPC